jgi:hypothetical protein
LEFGIGLVNLFLNNFNPIILTSFINFSFAIIAISIIAIYADDIKSFTKWIVYAGLINIFVLIVQKCGFNFVLNDSTTTFGAGEHGGIMGNAPQLGNYLALTLPFAIEFSWIVAIVYLICCFVIKEYTIFLIALVIFCLKFKKLKIPLLTGILILSVIIYKDILNSLQIRWQVWKPTIEVILQRYWIGYGLGTFSSVSNQFIKSPYQVDFAFNSYLQFVFGVGLAGAIWLIVLVRKLIKEFSLSTIGLAVLSLGILSLLEYPFEIPRLWITICVIIGIYIAQTKEAVCE